MSVVEEKKVIREFLPDQLKNLILSNDKTGKHCIVIKFTAEWCGPCKSIKELCNNKFNDMPENVILSEIDIDNSVELYMFLKRGKIRVVNGIPALLAWYPNDDRDENLWYLPDDSVAGSNVEGINYFFKQVNDMALDC